MESYYPALKLPIWREAALNFQSHQYVEIDIFKILDYSHRRETAYETRSESSLVRVHLESQISSCFLGSLYQLPCRDSF